MNKIIDFINRHIDFKIYNVTLIAFFTVILVIPCTMFLPQRFGYENGLLENIQMIFLFLTFFLCLKTKNSKKLFYFGALIIIILILREINCGRTLFFPIPGAENAFYSWKEIKYGWLAHPLYGTFIAWTCLYFFIHKLYIKLWHYIKNVKFPFWNILLLYVGIAVGLYAEHAMDNMILEEMGELLIYVSLAGIIWLYGFNDNFKIIYTPKDEDE